MPARGATFIAFPDLRFRGGAPFGASNTDQEALSLLLRLLAATKIGGANTHVVAHELEALAGGRSAARVFKATPLLGPREVEGAPVVVKIAPRAQGDRERANYEAHVRNGLPANCRPELIGFIRTRSLAGLSYSYIGSANGARLDTLTDCFQRGDMGALDLVLRSIVEPLRRTWCSPSQIQAESDIAQRYVDRYFVTKRFAREMERELRVNAARFFDARDDGTRLTIGAESFPSPYATLFAPSLKRACHSCIVHGDLNTDNIIVDPERDRAVLIDFQKTGRGHVFEDLAALECSVRINVPADVSHGDVFETERLIASGKQNPNSDSYLAVIRTIRDAAFRLFEDVEDRTTYHFAIAALGLRLMRATDLSEIARARIVASALWAAKVLAGELKD